MSESKILLYRLAELMLDGGSNELSVDSLFDDPEIGDSVRSIQIDSPYQQMLLQGVLTESVKENELKVRFTFEGYLQFILGSIIQNNINKFKGKINNDKLMWAGESDYFLLHDYLFGILIKENYNYFLSFIVSDQKFFKVASFSLAKYMDIQYNLSDFSDLNKIELILKKILSIDFNISYILLVSLSDLLKSSDKIGLFKYFNTLVSDNLIPNTSEKAIIYFDSIRYLEVVEANKKINTPNLYFFPVCDSFLFEFYLKKGLALQAVMRNYDAVFSYSLALKSRFKSGKISDLEIASTYSNLAGSISELNSNQKIIFFKKSINVLQKYPAKYDRFLALVYSNISRVYLKKKDYANSYRYLLLSKDLIFHRLGKYHSEVAKVYTVLGQHFLKKEDFENSEYYFQKAYKIVSRINIFSEFHSYLCLSMSFFSFQKGDFDNSILYRKIKIAIDIKLLGKYDLKNILNYQEIIHVLKKKNDYKTLIFYVHKLFRINRKVNGDSNKINHECLRDLSIAYAQISDFKSSIVYLNKLQKTLYISGGNDFFKMYFLTLYILANISKSKGYYNEALFFLKKFSFLKKNGKIFHEMGVVYEINYDRLKAYNYFLKASNIRKNNLGASSIKTMQSVAECLRLSKELNIFSDLPEWIKKNSQ